MLAFILLVAATVNAMNAKINKPPKGWGWKLFFPSNPELVPIDKEKYPKWGGGFQVDEVINEANPWAGDEKPDTFLRAEGEDAWDKFADKVMKKSIYEDLQDWQLMAIVKAAPGQVEMMEAKLKKTKQKCARRRNVFVPLVPWGSEVGASTFNPSGVVQFLSAEGKDNKEKAKSEGKKGKKDKKKEHAELVKKIESYDKKLKTLEKKIKKLSKKCKK